MQFSKMLALCQVVVYSWLLLCYPLSDMTVQMLIHFIHPCVTRAPAHTFHITPKDIVYSVTRV